MYRKFKIYLIISSIISIGLIVTLTYKVITETHSPQFFGVDFTNKYNEILSYSALIGTILTFLSIMFILFAILHEKNIYEEQKNEKESKSDEELQDRIILIRNIVSEIKTDISVLSGNMQSFIAEEKKEPHGFNDFLSPLFNNYYELIERDFSIVFKSFQSQFKSENKIEIFNKVFKQVNIYCNLLKEIKEKHKYHVYDKNREQKEILKEFNSLIDFCFIALENYKQEKNTESIKILENFTTNYLEFFKKNNDLQVDFEDLANNLIKTLLSESLEVAESRKSGDLQKIVLQSSILRKKINLIKKESLKFVDHFEKIHNKFFSSDSTYFEDLFSVENLE